MSKCFNTLNSWYIGGSAGLAGTISQFPNIPPLVTSLCDKYASIIGAWATGTLAGCIMVCSVCSCAYD